MEKTIKECIFADKSNSSGAREFVDWGGAGPIANFIEYILSFDISVPDQTITWRITRTERHGIQNLKFGDFYVQLICKERQTANEPCHLTVNSGGAFTLRIVVNGKTTESGIQKGTVTIQTG